MGKTVDEQYVEEVRQVGAELAAVEPTAVEPAAARREGDLGLGRFIPPKEVDGRSPEEVAYAAIVQQILDADTLDDVLTPIEAVNVDQVLGRPVEVLRFEAVESDFEQGSAWYAAIQVRHLDTGEQGVLTTGNQGVLAQLITIMMRDAFPVEGKFMHTGNPNRYGTRPIRLTKPDWESKKQT